jgi:hypothetical protein
VASATIRPSATPAVGGATVSGAASVHAALADDTDVSYVTIAPTATTISFGAPPLPAGAVVKSANLRVRGMGAISAPVLNFFFADAVRVAPSYVWFTWGTPTTLTIARLDSGGSAFTASFYRSASGALVLHEAHVDVAYVPKPAVDVTAPSGTLDGNIATVEWTPTLDGDGGAQTHYETKVFSAAQYGAGGFDPTLSTPTYGSGVVVSSADAHALVEPLPAATYRAYTRVGQTVNGSVLWSSWAYEPFTVPVLGIPPEPDLTATGDDDDGRIRLDATWTPTATSVDQVEIQKLLGDEWVALQTPEDEIYLAPTDDAVTVYDAEAANGVEETYRARTWHLYSAGSTTSDWVEATGEWAAPGVWWLKHPTFPSLNSSVVPHAQPEISRSSRQGAFQALGSSRVVVIDDTRGAASGSLTLRCDTVEAQEALDALLDAGVSLLLQGSPEDRWVDRWVRLSEHVRTPLTDKGYVEASYESFSWIEVGRPLGPHYLLFDEDHLLASPSTLLGPETLPH